LWMMSIKRQAQPSELIPRLGHRVDCWVKERYLWNMAFTIGSNFIYLSSLGRELRELASAVADQSVLLLTGNGGRADRRLAVVGTMSVIARATCGGSCRLGARFLEQQQGGRGVLVGRVPGLRHWSMWVILGGGVVGTGSGKKWRSVRGAQVTVWM
jgi:alanine dehydrogenase